MPTAQKRRRVAISVLCATYYGREAIRGILDYTSSYTNWEINHQGGGGELARMSTEVALRQWKAEGIIAQLHGEPLARAILRAKIPAVDIWSELDTGMVTIRPDDRAISRSVVEHFLNRGFHNFAWCSYGGDHHQGFTIRRREAFKDLLAQKGLECHIYPCSRSPSNAHEIEEMSRVQKWLRDMPKPLALMCPHDYRAREVVLACSWCGLHVPEDVAVMGVDNDPVECRLCHPHLSSVNTIAYEIGFQAAKSLDKMMKGGKAPSKVIEVPPCGIVTRKSSDTFAVQDPDTAAALHFIEEHAGESITVADVLAQVPMSRRSLERRFMELLGRTPREQILRSHVEQAKRLLENTSLKLAAVAAKSGFTPSQMFSRLFREVEGIQPSEYRRRFQGHENGTEDFAADATETSVDRLDQQQQVDDE